MKTVNPQRDLSEKLAEKRFIWVLPQLLQHAGVLCDIFKAQKTSERDVYGHFAGQKIVDELRFTTLVAGLPVAEFRPTASGQYGQGFFKDTESCYAMVDELEEGDVLRPRETDIQLIITNITSLGNDGRISRFHASSIQEGIRPDLHSYPEKLIIQ